jgi:AraC-like DNA-binding protein
VSRDERLYLRTETRALIWPTHAGPDSAFHAADPAPELRARVAKIRWGYESIPPDAPVQERLVPDGSIHLLFDLASTGAGGARATVLGPTSKPTVIRLSGRIEQMGVELRPGAVAALFGVPARELSGHEIALQDLWGARAAELRERLLGARDAAGRIRMVNQALAGALARSASETPPALGESLRRITRAGGNLRIADLAAGLGITDRRLEQLFHWHVGLSPKMACRLARFRAAIEALAVRSRPSWAEIALDCGFADQSHLVNEFRAFTGLAPRELQQRAGFRSLQD